MNASRLLAAGVCGICLGAAPVGASVLEGRVLGVERSWPPLLVTLSADVEEPPRPAPDVPLDPVVIDQQDMRFEPDVVVVPPGTTVEFPNSDRMLHNVFSPRGPGRGFDLGTYPPGQSRMHTFEEVGVHMVLCRIHPEMAAFVAVVPSAHHAFVDDDGAFRLEGAPAGGSVLRLWRARRMVLELPVALPAGQVTTITLDLKPRARQDGE